MNKRECYMVVNPRDRRIMVFSDKEDLALDGVMPTIQPVNVNDKGKFSRSRMHNVIRVAIANGFDGADVLAVNTSEANVRDFLRDPFAGIHYTERMMLNREGAIALKSDLQLEDGYPEYGPNDYFVVEIHNFVTKKKSNEAQVSVDKLVKKYKNASITRKEYSTGTLTNCVTISDVGTARKLFTSAKKVGNEVALVEFLEVYGGQGHDSRIASFYQK